MLECAAGVSTLVESEMTKSTGTALKQRSAIQFIIDDFGDFPVNDKLMTVRDRLDELQIGETIQILDNIIKKWNDNPDSSSDDDCDDKCESDWDKSDTEGIPASHTWWFTGLCWKRSNN